MAEGYSLTELAGAYSSFAHKGSYASPRIYPPHRRYQRKSSVRALAVARACFQRRHSGTDQQHAVCRGHRRDRKKNSRYCPFPSVPKRAHAAPTREHRRVCDRLYRTAYRRRLDGKCRQYADRHFGRRLPCHYAMLLFKKTLCRTHPDAARRGSRHTLPHRPCDLRTRPYRCPRKRQRTGQIYGDRTLPQKQPAESREQRLYRAERQCGDPL